MLRNAEPEELRNPLVPWSPVAAMIVSFLRLLDFIWLIKPPR
jgi:hypothetical protein